MGNSFHQQERKNLIACLCIFIRIATSYRGLKASPLPGAFLPVNFIHGILDCEKEDVKKLLTEIKKCNRNGYGKIKCMQLDWLIEALQNTITEYMGDTVEETFNN